MKGQHFTTCVTQQSVPSHAYFGVQTNGEKKIKRTSGEEALFLVYRKDADAQSSYSHKGGIKHI